MPMEDVKTNGKPACQVLARPVTKQKAPSINPASGKPNKPCMQMVKSTFFAHSAVAAPEPIAKKTVTDVVKMVTP